MSLRGIRGATTVDKNSKEEIWQASSELVMKVLELNRITVNDIGAIIFSITEDLTTAFPTTIIRQDPKFKFVPLFDTQEPPVENSLPMCLRVLVLIESDTSPNEVRHVYLHGAKKLRPDLM